MRMLFTGNFSTLQLTLNNYNNIKKQVKRHHNTWLCTAYYLLVSEIIINFVADVKFIFILNLFFLHYFYYKYSFVFSDLPKNETFI